MRYDTPIFFQRIEQGEYNATTGDYSESKTVEVKEYASVTDTGTNALTLIYGSIKQGSLTIRLQRAYTEPFDRIRVGDKVYRVDFARKAKNFVISEVQ